MATPETHPSERVTDLSGRPIPGLKRLVKDARGEWRAYFVADLAFRLNDGTNRVVMGPLPLGTPRGQRVPPESPPAEICVRMRGQVGRKPPWKKSKASAA